MKNKKQILLIVAISVILVTFIVCFVIALNNHKSTKTTNTNNDSASKISSQYDNINYGDSLVLDDSNITSGGSYDLSGTYSCIVINTTKDVQLNLTDVTITCEEGPGINIEDAKTVNIVLNGENKITSTTTEDLDGAIYSKADLVLSGDGSLDISSNYDGIVSKDTLVIKSGTYNIDSKDDGIRGKDSIAIVDGTFNITSVSDGIKATNEEDDTKGYIAIDGGTFNIKTSGNTSSTSSKGIKAVTKIEINGGTFEIDAIDDGIHCDGDITINNGNINITSKDDAIHADGMIEVNNGEISLNAAEGIEATYVKINDGTINIKATDDGINAGNKSDNYTVTIEINGGDITIDMGQGDRDGIDSNGNLYINGGTINVTAQSPFDYDGKAEYNGGTLIVNGEETNSITNQMMGGGMQKDGGRNMQQVPGGNRGFMR